MGKILFILLLFSLNLIADEPVLQLDTKGHIGVIKDIIVTQSGDIISASDDKTIRVWDSTTGKEKRKILGEIGAGPAGAIYAIALSPDEQYLATGGYFRNNEIRIYHYATGKLIKLLKSHTNAVLGLSFGSDGKYLISGSFDKTAKIWNVTDSFSLEDTITFHTKEIYAVKIIKKGDNYFAVTAGTDKQVALYDMQKRKVLKSKKDKYILGFLAVADNLFGGRIAVSGSGKEITIYDYNLNFIKKVKSETEPAGLAYSTNGKLMIAGTAAYPFNVNIYQSKNNYRKKISFRKHTNTTTAVNFLNNQKAVSAGGDNFEIYLWSVNNGKVVEKIVGAGKRVWSVGLRGDRIAWGNKLTAAKGKSKLQKSIDLKTMEIKNKKQKAKSFKRIPTRYKNYTLSSKKGGAYGYADTVLEIKRGNKTVAKIVKDSTDGYRHNCYGFYKNTIISGGSGGHLKIYNLKGKEIASLAGHTGEIWSIALDGDRLVSGSGDQTIRIWNLKELKKDVGHQTLYPQLNLFTTKDNEWVLWSQSGYFASSVNGDKYIGYHINRGPDKEAYFVSSAKYYDKLYRPDIIRAILETGSEKRAIESISHKSKVEKADIVSEMPPILTLLSDSYLTTGADSATVRFTIKSPSEIEKMIVTLNGRQLDTKILFQGESRAITVALDEGENIISIRAKNQYAVSDAILVNATRTSRTAASQSEAIYKPTLYLLSIGVSRYQNSAYNLSSADKDANSIVEMFKRQEGKIYKKVVVKELLNEKATKDNILEALDWIERESTQRDLVIIFVAGHGINDDKGNYYFMSHDSDIDSLRRTALRWIEIKDTLTDLPSKVILMVDTCHSGNILGQEKRRDITGAIKSIINTGTGSVIMTASTGRGYSIENKSWGHGAFTKALLEGLDKARADYNHNRTISIKEIDLYVTDRVKELTRGKQKPTTIIPESMPDFALGVR